MQIHEQIKVWRLFVRDEWVRRLFSKHSRRVIIARTTYTYITAPLVARNHLPFNLPL